MTLALWLLVLALVAAGVAGLLLPGLPGTPLVLAGIVLAAWIDGFQRIGWVTIGIVALLTALAAVADIVGAALGAKRFGGTRWGALGAVLGALVGLLFGLPGIIIGPFVGAVALELVAARKERDQALKAGFGTVVGLILATAAKAALVIAMIGISVFAYVV